MATPKLKASECPLRLACDGRLIRPNAKECVACREVLKRREKQRKGVQR